MNLIWIAVVVVFSNFIISTDGRGCFVDPKIQVVRIPNEQQWILLREAKRNCTYDQLTKWTNTSHKGLMCDSTFDDVMCWPPTAAGTTAAQYCPSYISNFNVTGRATRHCRKDGTWYKHPDINVTGHGWTNFTGCLNRPKGNLLKTFTHLEIIYGIVTTGYCLSFGCLSIAVAIMLIFRKLRCPRNTIHLNMFLCFMLRAVICFVKDLYTVPEGRSHVEGGTAKLSTVGTTWPCKLVHSVFNYAILASYTWIFVEGAYLHSLIFKTMTESKKFHRYLIVFGWGKLQKNETNVSPSTNYTTKDPLTD